MTSNSNKTKHNSKNLKPRANETKKSAWQKLMRAECVLFTPHSPIYSFLRCVFSLLQHARSYFVTILHTDYTCPSFKRTKSGHCPISLRPVFSVETGNRAWRNASVIQRCWIVEYPSNLLLLNLPRADNSNHVVQVPAHVHRKVTDVSSCRFLSDTPCLRMSHSVL